jgi:hypothetical protein
MFEKGGAPKLEMSRSHPVTYALYYPVSDLVRLSYGHTDLVRGARLEDPGEGKISKVMVNGTLYDNRPRPYATNDSELDRTPEVMIVDLTYPLRKMARVTVYPFYSRAAYADGRTFQGDAQMTLGHLLRELARAYRKIYREPEKWEVYGHSIGDLMFESLTIKFAVIDGVEHGIGVVDIGS